MEAVRHSLAIDFGSRYIGLALVRHTDLIPNRVVYATTVVVDAKPLNEAVQVRSQVRRIRRTRKTHARRLRGLSQALAGIPGSDTLVRFCERRGYSHDEPEADDETLVFRHSREQFFAALRDEVERTIPAANRERVLTACGKHLNERRHREAELRPARFLNRGPTQCQWAECQHNVPKAGHDILGRLQQSLFLWLRPVFDVSADPARLRRSVDHWLGELDALASALQTVETLPEEERKTARKPINARKNKVYTNLLERVEREAPGDIGEAFASHWTDYYKDQVTEVVGGKASGRVRYCRQHSLAFVEHSLQGKVIPNSTDIDEADLISRKQQIVFMRLWRLIQARVLPLAGTRIDRIIVERVAFDVLAGSFKARRDVTDDKASQMYWHGPQFGFESRREMLQAEFGGRCAYCNDNPGTEEVEHLLPRSEFPFDSYFNIVPACRSCNARKGARSPVAAGMTITDAAYEGYCDYVAKRKPVPHFYHTIKKGMLNLLRRPGTSEHAERMLSMLADNLVTITATQRSPRPLARYLATKLDRLTGQRPETSWRAGRHTALYRAALFPDYDKSELREDSDLRNHAVDAVVLGCELPSASALENRQWARCASNVQEWFQTVKRLGPPLVDGLPHVEPVDFVPHFEMNLGGGYCQIDLSAFNWNRRRQATHKLDPLGMTTSGLPLKRTVATSVLTNLKTANKVDAQIAAIAHRGLRTALSKNPAHSPTAFVRWLQQSVAAGLTQNTMSRHPADIERRRLLTDFVAALVEHVVDSTVSIPEIIGVKCINAGARGKLDLARVDKTGRAFQHFMAAPVVRALHVGYRMVGGTLDRSKPIRLFVDQAWRVRLGSQRTPLDLPPDSPLMGRRFGAKQPLAEFLSQWNTAFAEWCATAGVAKCFRITQGCVIEKVDGSNLQFRNFDKGGAWMKAPTFREIRRIHRSPLRAMPKS